MAIQLAPISIVIEHNIARVKTDKGKTRMVGGRERERQEKEMRSCRHNAGLQRGRGARALFGGVNEVVTGATGATFQTYSCGLRFCCLSANLFRCVTLKSNGLDGHSGFVVSNSDQVFSLRDY